MDPKIGFSYTKLIEINGAKSWSVPFYETFGIKIKDQWFLEAHNDAEMIIEHWSGDGKYAYLYPFICCLDGPVLFNGLPALYQLNLDTGELKDILPSGSRIGFSPDDKYLAYRTFPATLHLRNLQTDDDSSFQLDSKYANLGVFSWSPDSQKLVFVAALEDWDKNMYMYEPTPASADGFSLLLLDLETMKITTLIDNDIRLLAPGSSSYYESDNAWADNDKIYLAQMNIAGRDEVKIWLYDINKRQLTSFATSTPFPAPSRPIPTSQEHPFPTPSPNPTAFALKKKWHSNGPVLLSPDGQWGVPAFSTGNQMIVTNIVTDLTRTIPCSLFLPSCASINAIHWSKDSRYLYLAASGWYGETSMAQPLFSELARIDVQSGKFEKLIGNSSVIPQDDGSFSSPDDYDFAISPDDRYVAYVKSSYADDKDKVEFGILTTEKLRDVEKRALDRSSAGDIAWSPSSNHLVFQTAGSGGQSIAYYDLNTKTLRYVVQDEQNYALSIRDWDANLNLVMLVMEAWDDRVFSYWYLNPFTNEILPVSTPSPIP